MKIYNDYNSPQQVTLAEEEMPESCDPEELLAYIITNVSKSVEFPAA